jgi:large subunit ribosomal protein L4
VVEDFQFDAPKTKSFQAALSALGVADKKSLWVLGAPNQKVYLSGRNLKATEVLTNDELNTYKIMNAQHLVLAESALAAIEANLSK